MSTGGSMKTIILTYKEQLDHAVEQGCQNPKCNHEYHEKELYLNQKCHPNAGLGVKYFKGVMSVVCQLCELPVRHIAVARLGDASVQG